MGGVMDKDGLYPLERDKLLLETATAVAWLLKFLPAGSPWGAQIQEQDRRLEAAIQRAEKSGFSPVPR